MQSITHYGFKGTNLIEENLPPNISPYSLNVDTERGIASKRLGITSLFETLIGGGANSLHKAKLSSGETLVLGHSTKAYKLSGTESAITKTTTADFSAGTINSNATISNNISIKEYAKTQYDFSTQAEYDAWGKEIVTNNTYGTPTKVIEQANDLLHYKLVYYSNGYNQVYANIQTKKTIDLTHIDSISFELSQTSVWHYRYLDSPISTVLVIDGVSKFTSSIQNGTIIGTVDTKDITGEKEVLINVGVTMPFIEAYGDSTLTLDVYVKNIRFRSSLPDAEYISESIDLGQTPEANKITFTETEYPNQVVYIYTRGSHDNDIWSEWEIKSNNDAIPLTRYIQTKCVIPNPTGYVTRLTKPTLSDFTITYTPVLNQVTEFDTSLSGNKIRWQNYSDNLYYTDGGIPRVYDGTNVRQLGVDAPTTTCTAAVGASPGLTGEYYYRITYVQNGVESNPSPASVSVTVTDQKINLTNIPTKTGMYRKIYRTLAGGSAYYFLTLIEDDTTTTYEDNIADTTIELSSRLLKTDNGRPPESTIIYEYKNYMFYVSATEPTRLYFSKPYGTDPDYPLAAFEQVPSTNWKELPDKITGLKAYQNKLIVTGEDFTGFFTGNVWGGVNDDTSWYLVDDIGAIRHEAIEICQSLDGAICALGTKYGVKYFIPSLYENGLERLPLSYDIQPYFDNGILDNMWLQFYNSRLFVGFIYYEGTPITYNNVVAVYDFKRKTWDGLWTINLNDTSVFNGLLYGCSSKEGKVFQLLSGYSDDGEDIHMIYDLRGDLGKYAGSIQRLKVQATNTSVTDALNINIQVDGNALTLPTGSIEKWRKSADLFGKQDLMERVLSVKRRGTFYGLRIEDDSTNAIDINKIIVDFQGVKE